MNEVDELAEKIYIALLTNSARYRYITKLFQKGNHSQEELNQKNAKKAYMLAETFLKVKNNRYSHEV